MDDASIVQMYWDRREQAIRETDIKYGKLCFSLVKNILKHNEDTEECVNDTYLNVWNSIPDNRPTHFAAYICQIAKRLAFNKLRYNKADKRNTEMYISLEELSDIISGKDNPEDSCLAEELSSSINDFLTKENVRDRQIFVRRYWYFDSIEDVAEMFQLNPKTVVSVLLRMRNRLKIYLLKEGYEL